MKIFVFLLVLAAFIQTSFLQINLCLILLICQSFIAEEKINIIVGFLIGIFLGILSSQNIGFWAITFVLVIKITHLARSLPLSNNFLTIIPIAFLIVTTIALVEQLIFHQSINMLKIFLETTLSLPIFILLKLWEDRFVVKEEIKLKIRG